MSLAISGHCRNHAQVWSQRIEAIAPVCVLGGIIWGAILRFHFPSTPLSDPDTWGYLNPALTWLSGLGFQQTAGRNWLYPGILAGILKFGGDFSWITYVQHILGLLAAWIMWMTYRLWRMLLPQRIAWLRILEIPIGLSAVFLYLLSSRSIVFEASIRPEGVEGFFGFSYLFCVVCYFSARWRCCCSWRSIVFGAGSLAGSYLLFLLKPVVGFALLFAFIPVIVGTVGKGSLAARLGPLLVGLALIALLVVAPHILGFQKDGASQKFLPLTLVSVHAKQIVGNAQKPYSQSSIGQHQDASEDAFYQSLEKAFLEAKRDPGGFQLLGFNADYIIYSSNVFQEVARRQHWNDRQLAAFCYSVYLKTWLGSPLEMLAKVCRQLTVFFFPPRKDFYSGITGFNFGRAFLYSLHSMPTSPKLRPSVQALYSSYLDKLRYPPGNDRDSGGGRFFRFVAELVEKLSVWVQLGFFVALILTWFKRGVSRLRLSGLAVLVVATLTYGTVLTVAVVHTLDIERYRISYSPFYLLTLAMMTTFLLVVASRLVTRSSLGRPKQNSGEHAFYSSKSARV